MSRVRHQPPRLASLRPTDVFLSSKTPFMAAVKRVDRALDKAKAKRLGNYVRVLGTGKAIQKVLALAMELQTRKKYHVEIRTRTIDTLDETIDEKEGIAKLDKRPLAVVELQVSRIE